MIDLSVYTPEHREELERLLQEPDWQAVLSAGLVEEVIAGRIEPGATRDFIGTVMQQLLAFNRERVVALIAQGCSDEAQLVEELARWPQGLEGRDPSLSFVGINLTAKCNLEPKCSYCNQPWTDATVDLVGWKGVLTEVTGDGDAKKPYIYLTGGEPLVLGEAVWGDQGLVRYATERGAGVNVNTNAVPITPEVALRLIKAGLYRVHISLDTPDPALHERLRGKPGLDQVLRGIYNLQLARDLVGVSYPVIHTNCVLTNESLDGFPELFAFVLQKRKQTVDSGDPFFNDLFTHVIPVGGEGNEHLRPTAEGFRRFYDEVWPRVAAMWTDYQSERGVPTDKQGTLFGYFSNPFLRVEHEGGLEAYGQVSAEGRYGKLALARHCYVAPTQAAFSPDGLQYRCGSHAIRRELPLGRVGERGVYDGIREGIAGLDELPREEHCYGCALATLYINQAVEKKLKEEVAALLHPEVAIEKGEPA